MFVYPERRVAEDRSCYLYLLWLSLSRGIINLKNTNLGNDTVPVYRLKFSTVLNNFVRLTYSIAASPKKGISWNFAKFLFVCFTTNWPLKIKIYFLPPVSVSICEKVKVYVLEFNPFPCIFRLETWREAPRPREWAKMWKKVSEKSKKNLFEKLSKSWK